MKFQQRNYWCGPAALQNAAAALGLVVSQEHLAGLAGTTAAGTDSEGLTRAAIAVGLDVDRFNAYDAGRAFALLGWHLINGNPVLLPVDRWDHWVVVVGLLGRSMVVADPAGRECGWQIGEREGGAFVVPWPKLAKRWRAARRVRQKLAPYFGLGVSL